MAAIHRSPFIFVTAALGLVLMPAGNARAGEEFEDGFRDELGRIAAHGAVGAGRAVLAPVLLADYPGQGRSHRWRDHDRHRERYRSWDRGPRRSYWHRSQAYPYRGYGHPQRGYGGWRWFGGGWGHRQHGHHHHHGCGH